MAITEARLKEIERRASRATPGPWGVSVGWTLDSFKAHSSASAGLGAVGPKDGTAPIGGDKLTSVVAGVCYSEKHGPDRDLEFIAEARTDVPDLIEEIRRLRRELRSKS